ncbi:MAG: heavy metal translocating P-type ATPase [Candidatus Jorgensenbacteria bacterium]
MDTRQKTFTCPMHPEVQESQPGMCPECGMHLVPVKEKKEDDHRHGGGNADTFDKHAGHKTESFLKKFWVSAALTVPIILYSELPEQLFGWAPPPFAGAPYLTFALGSLIFFYGGWVFLAGAWRELRGKLPGMMTLIAIAIAAAYFWSAYATFSGDGHTLFWELATLITVMLLGHWLEMRAVASTQGALKELSKLLPDTAEVIRDGKRVMIGLRELKEGDVVFVRPGAGIPADGAVTEGRSQVNESMVSGESKPVEKGAGSEVIAGTINGDGALTVRVTKIGEHTFLAGVMRLVRDAQASKSRLQMLSDRAAFFLTLIAVASGGIAFVGWLLAGADTAFAFERLVAVLVIACPHALGLAVPLVASLSTTLAARKGFLVRERLALERARNIDIVLFDKTGTLTKGEYGVEKVLAAAPFTESRVLQYAASVDQNSEHFVARAIVREARNGNVSLLPVKNFERIPGKGVRGAVGEAQVTSGGEAMFTETNHPLPPAIAASLREYVEGGSTIIYVTANGALAGAIALADIIRDESREAVRDLKAMGLKVAMLTGDSEAVAQWVAKELDLNEYFAKVLPQEKAAKVKELQARGLRVAMVGDGVNDAPALTQADVGIAVGAGTNVAIESAGIVLMRSDPRDIAKIISLSRATYRKMLQNLFWATGYNVVAIPLAGGVLASQGILLQPAASAVLMSLSTVIVAANALLLRRWAREKPHPHG